MAKFFIPLCMCLATLSVAAAQSERRQPTTTPVPILKQVNRVNEDGSYTYGYENADGSYKIESKDVNGQIQGKYGYYDDVGQLREIEYGASKAGFYPSGTGVKAPVVAPPRDDPDAPTDGSYDPRLYTLPYQYDNEVAQQYEQPAAPPQQQRPRKAKAGRRQQGARAIGGFQNQQQFQQPQPQYQQAAQPQYPQQSQPQYQQQPQHQQQSLTYQQQQQQYLQQQQQYQLQQQQYQQNLQQQQPQPQAPQAAPFNQAQAFHGHPARNIDINTGSYSLNYSG